MRRFFISTLLIMLFIGCNPIDIDKELSKRDEQIAKLEELCGKISGDIESLKSLITALQNNDTVTSVTPIVIDGVEVGYTITFTKSEPITILHGTDGKDGEKFFHSITEDDEFVYLTLVDGTTITIQKGEKMLSNKIFCLVVHLLDILSVIVTSNRREHYSTKEERTKFSKKRFHKNFHFTFYFLGAILKISCID